MPKGNRKRTEEEYEREIEEASKRIRKHRENITSARDSDTWIDFLTDTFGVSPQAVNNGQDFWESVRQDILQYDREEVRKLKYRELREQGFSAKEARRMRDWSQNRVDLSKHF